MDEELQPSAYRAALRERYPLAGHHGDCRKVVAATVQCDRPCTCGWDERKDDLASLQVAPAGKTS